MAMTMRYTFTALMNETRGSRFIEYTHDADLSYGARITVEADNLDAALEAAWVVGNRQAPDADDRDWPANIRSLSVADVLVLADDPVVHSYAVADIGFNRLPPVVVRVASDDYIRLVRVD